MSAAVAVEAVRPRPLSGGLWTLFSWLRRDERYASSDSLSSAGSDRTAASFAFLGPGHYVTADPLAIPPPGPPTDSYKKRVRDRNLRRNRDRDVTLLRKYGLHGFDAFTLPNVRLAGPRERDRRATSEVLHRRVHVPGKRRAPPPPTAPTSLTRRRATKRPAPQPPAIHKPTTEDKVETKSDNTQSLPMNSQRISDTPTKHGEVTMGCKSEKYVKKESKEVKPRQDKSFLKQIFDNRKRHSAIDTTSVKLLPSISELDKQAHEIIEKYKLKELEHNSQEGRIDNNSPGSSKPQTESWICTRCLRKYNASVITCLYCLPLENALLNNASKSSKVTNYTQTTSNSNRSSVEEKEKLKEILKEMKDSLPKIPAAGPSNLTTSNKASNENIAKRDYPKVVESPTLRIGSSVSAEIKNMQPQPSTRKVEPHNDKPLSTIDNVLVTQPVVLVHTKDNIVIVDEDEIFQRREVLPQSKPLGTPRKLENVNMTKTQIASKILSEGKKALDVSSKDKPDINTPLKVSSLLNPIYVPRATATSTHTTKSSNEQTEAKVTQSKEVKPIKTVLTHSSTNTAMPSTSQTQSKLFNVFSSEEKARLEDTKQSSSKESDSNVKKIEDTATSNTEVAVSSSATSSNPPIKTSVVEMIDQHSRRRNLINQLEKSIADGDERAAADAAVKLAQLKLSCSVLSFSSQIASEPSASGVGKTNYRKTDEISKTSQMKLNAAPAFTPVQSNEQPKHQTTDNSNKSNEIINEPKKLQENAMQINVPPPLKSALPATAATRKAGPVKLQREKIDKAIQNPVRCEPSTSKDNVKKDNIEDVPILVWVEDKEATRGPVQIHVGRKATLGDLRRQADKSLGLAVRMQRWIIGRALCSDDNTPLVTLAGPELTAPFYLCLVESETKKPVEPEDAKVDSGNVYNELVKLEQQALVPNAETFDCGVCMEQCLPGSGVILRDCVHSFCMECLSDVVRHSQEPIVGCPATGCRGVLQEREIRALVSGDDYDKWLARGLAIAESGTRNSFHCRTRDCTGWALCDPGVLKFPCPVCKRTNCVPCQAIHEGKTCEQHRATVESTSNDASQTDEGTRALLDSLIARGEALQCPECSAIITKKWGCDWIKCSACKTEICWVTRGRRWGPAGRGDTTAGCRCGVDGKKCHPSCGYCH